MLSQEGIITQDILLILSPDDEQSILFETSRPNRLSSEPTLL